MLDGGGKIPGLSKKLSDCKKQKRKQTPLTAVFVTTPPPGSNYKAGDVIIPLQKALSGRVSFAETINAKQEVYLPVSLPPCGSGGICRVRGKPLPVDLKCCECTLITTAVESDAMDYHTTSTYGP
jgi:hypothetical protein